MKIKPPAIEIKTGAKIESQTAGEKLLTLAAKASLFILKGTARYFHKRTQDLLHKILKSEKSE